MLTALYLIWLTLVTNNPLRRSQDPRYLALHNESLFGGDMILPPNYLLKNGILNEEYRWPGYPGGAKIPYVIDNALVNSTDLILNAMQAYHKGTCVRFVPWTTENEYVRIFSGSGCYSTVGKFPVVTVHEYEGQPLSLAPGCLNIGTIIHELGHAIGFYHEQNRSDRDDYLIVNQKNVDPNQRHNFRKLKPSENLLLTPFDYDSIMIYGNFAFSRHPFMDMTVEARNGQLLLEPYEKKGMTKSDIERVQRLYKCI